MNFANTYYPTIEQLLNMGISKLYDLEIVFPDGSTWTEGEDLDSSSAWDFRDYQVTDFEVVGLLFRVWVTR